MSSSARAGVSVPALSTQRLAWRDWPRERAPQALGALLYRHDGADDANETLAAVSARRLLAAEPMIDAWWSSAGTQTSGRCGRVRWRHDGHWLYGALDIDEAAEGLSFETLAQRAYRELFDSLRATGWVHLLRVWNYLPQINAASGGLERYRQFNAGRQQAFLDARQSIGEGSPAACALGTRAGALCIRFLAGRAAALAVENPRQVSAYRYPRDYGARSPTFSRAALLDAGGGRVALLISGTASIVGHASVHAGDVPAQVRETLANLRAVIAAAHAHTSARFDLGELEKTKGRSGVFSPPRGATAVSPTSGGALELTVYVRHAADAPLVHATLEAELGAGAAALQQALYLEADICRSELLVEIEAHAFAAGRLKP